MGNHWEFRPPTHIPCKVWFSFGGSWEEKTWFYWRTAVPCAQTKCSSSNQHFGGARLRLFCRLSMIKPHITSIQHWYFILVWIQFFFLHPRSFSQNVWQEYISLYLSQYLQVLFAAVVGACLLAAPFNELRDRQLYLGMRPVFRGAVFCGVFCTPTKINKNVRS